MVTMSFFFSFFITYLSNASCFIHIKPISIESPGVTRLLRDSGTTLGSVYTMPEVAFQESKLRGGNRSLSEHARLTLYIWIFFLGLGRTPSPICINKKAKNKTKHTPPPQISSHYKPIYYKPITMDCKITNSNEKSSNIYTSLSTKRKKTDLQFLAASANRFDFLALCMTSTILGNECVSTMFIYTSADLQMIVSWPLSKYNLRPYAHYWTRKHWLISNQK